MDGPEGAAQRTADWLYGRLPARLRIIEARLNLEAATLPNPSQVLAHERGPLGIEDWPSVFVLPQGSVRNTFVDTEPDGSETYLVTYNMQVLGWVRADSYESTNTLRLRYALAIREALLERKQLALPGGHVAGNPDSDLAVDPASIRESYSPVLTDESKRTIAGVTVNLNVTVREVLAPPPPLGTVNTTDVDTVPLPAHPALD